MKTFAIVLLIFVFSATAFAAKQYSYFRVGNPTDVTTATAAGTVLMGGGTDVDAAFQWMCQRSGNGDFLLFGAAEPAPSNPSFNKSCPRKTQVPPLIIRNPPQPSNPSL